MTAAPFDWIDDELAALRKQALLRERVERAGPQGAEVSWNGQRLINFGSNDYLGLAAELPPVAMPEIGGWGSGASPLISGRGEPQARLERALADFEGAEAAMLFSSGYAANVGCLAALAGKPDVIFSDAKNHASIIDGCRLSGARIVVFPHRDVDALSRLLGQASGFRRRLIVTDSVFSMDGDLAPLDAYADLARARGAMLIVDEAHGTGVFGRHGRGLCEQLGVEEQCPVRVGTLSKALGSVGGFVVGPEPVIMWLVNRARSYFFSTAPPDAVAQVALAALEIVRREPQRRTDLLQAAAEMRQELTDRGWSVGDSASQIIPVYLGDPQATLERAAALRARGLFVPGIRPPSVPEGESMLRISLTYRHQAAHRAALLEGLGRNHSH